MEDVTTLCLSFRKRSAVIQSSWLDSRKVREMTIVGSTRMIVYDDVAQHEKIRIFDARVERRPITTRSPSSTTPTITAICMRPISEARSRSALNANTSSIASGTGPGLSATAGKDLSSSAFSRPSALWIR